MAAALTGSLAARFLRVSSESTTPQPKVSSRGLRSNTVISWPGLRSFRLMAKYNPAGPPPRQAMFMGAASGFRSAARSLRRTQGYCKDRCGPASAARETGGQGG